MSKRNDHLASWRNPHGPHPGAMERSIGAKETRELAVMVDTFRPLLMTEHAVSIEDPNYFLSWLPNGENNPGMKMNDITS